jgi:hypothetical protein
MPSPPLPFSFVVVKPALGPSVVNRNTPRGSGRRFGDGGPPPGTVGLPGESEWQPEILIYARRHHMGRQ